MEPSVLKYKNAQYHLKKDIPYLGKILNFSRFLENGEKNFEIDIP